MPPILMKTNDICYLTETWLNEGEVNQFELIFNEYNLFHQSDVSIEESYQLRGRPFGGKFWLLGKQLKVKKVEFINKILSIVEIGVGKWVILRSTFICNRAAYATILTFCDKL
jgi:hypothetical protein